MSRSRFVVPLLITLSLLAGGVPCHAQDAPKEVVQSYIANLIHEDWVAAEAFWHPDDIRRSQRLGLLYMGTPLKIDCASPLIPLVDNITSGDVVFGYGDITVDDGLATVPVRVGSASHGVEHRYHVLETDDGWKLVSPLTAHARTWSYRDTRYARIFYSDSTLLNDYALAELDRFIDEIADRLQIFDDDLRHLQNLKLEYYLCNEDQIKQITGYAVHGMTSLPMDAIVTRHLPHYHELVHALTNYRLRRIPLHTLPVVQEGLAVALGGRWEKSADVLLQFGTFMLEADLVTLDSVLTNSGFQTGVGSLDISYAAGGLLSRYLIDTYGSATFLKLYDVLSTPDTELNDWDSEHIQYLFSRVYQLPWSTMVADVHEFASSNGDGRLRPGGAIPEAGALISLSDDGITVDVWNDNDAYVFAVSTESDHPEISIILHDDAEPVNTSYRSRLFAKHHPDMPYDQARFGLLVTNAEAGLYDYYTDNLIEKYVLSFDPSDAYWDADTKQIRFRLGKSALPRMLSEYRVSIRTP